MKDNDLISRYRNLLIHVARQKRDAVRLAEAIATSAAAEEMPGRKAGLMCKVKSLRKHARTLEMLLSRNRAASLHFFKTEDQKQIAEQDVIYVEQLLTTGQPLLTSSQQHVKAIKPESKTRSPCVGRSSEDANIR